MCVCVAEPISFSQFRIYFRSCCCQNVALESGSLVICPLCSYSTYTYFHIWNLSAQNLLKPSGMCMYILIWHSKNAEATQLIKATACIAPVSDVGTDSWSLSFSLSPQCFFFNWHEPNAYSWNVEQKMENMEEVPWKMRKVPWYELNSNYY